MNKLCTATSSEVETILKLYQNEWYGPADWDEHYPSMETIQFDLSRDALYVLKNEQSEIIAALSIDLDKAVEELPCWSKLLAPGVELSRVVVKKEYQGQGIVKEMMRLMFEELRKMQKKSIHILVRPTHARAISAYKSLGFEKVGDCHLYEKHFVCMETAL